MNKRQKKKFKKKLYHRRWKRYKEWKGVVTIIRRRIKKHPSLLQKYLDTWSNNTDMVFSSDQLLEINSEGDDTNEQETEKEV